MLPPKNPDMGKDFNPINTSNLKKMMPTAKKNTNGFDDLLEEENKMLLQR